MARVASNDILYALISLLRKEETSFMPERISTVSRLYWIIQQSTFKGKVQINVYTPYLICNVIIQLQIRYGTVEVVILTLPYEYHRLHVLNVAGEIAKAGMATGLTSSQQGRSTVEAFRKMRWLRATPRPGMVMRWRDGVSECAGLWIGVSGVRRCCSFSCFKGKLERKFAPPSQQRLQNRPGQPIEVLYRKVYKWYQKWVGVRNRLNGVHINLSWLWDNYFSILRGPYICYFSTLKGPYMWG